MREPSIMHADATGLRIGIAASVYHWDIVGPLASAATAAFAEAGGDQSDLTMIESPGAFELVAICSALARREDIDGVVALGCVIRGETSHDSWINSAVAHGLVTLSVATGKPAAFGVLTCNTHEQAVARSGGDKGNKGEEAMKAAIAAVREIRAINGTEGTVSS
jgi:6,7-dimethyl-8-ribityllumazine synthase